MQTECEHPIKDTETNSQLEKLACGQVSYGRIKELIFKVRFGGSVSPSQRGWFVLGDFIQRRLEVRRLNSAFCCK